MAVGESAGILLGLEKGQGFQDSFRAVVADLWDVGVSGVIETVFAEEIGKQLCEGGRTPPPIGSIVLLDLTPQPAQFLPSLRLLLLGHGRFGKSLRWGLAL